MYSGKLIYFLVLINSTLFISFYGPSNVIYVFVRLQMLQRVVMVAAESLKVLEHQLMDGGQKQDVRVGKKHLKALIYSPLHYFHYYS